MEFETKCLHAGYQPENGGPRVLPIVQSTTYAYDSTDEIGKLFDLEAAGYFYTRLANPTTGAVEEKIAALEGALERYAHLQVKRQRSMLCLIF